MYFMYDLCILCMIYVFLYNYMNHVMLNYYYTLYRRYSYMIDNIMLLITGTLHQRQISELRSKFHPFGRFEELESGNIASTPADLYNAILVDTPLGKWFSLRLHHFYFISCDVAPYFKECVSEQDLDEIHIEIIRNTLFKTYLEDFYKFCKELGGTTAEVMGTILEVDSHRALINHYLIPCSLKLIGELLLLLSIHLELSLPRTIVSNCILLLASYTLRG